ncbi:MAG: lamin tail domain-containing protein, partial [Polaribacter sp.]|nr:lamin tail domain-containing protein [Polaribacter sp.]
MKKLYFLKIIIFIVVILFSSKTNSQSAGDIAFIALNADGNDDFAFVALADIPANTTIWFTDNEWDGDSFNDTGEGEVSWSHTSILPAGSIVVIAGNAGGTASLESGSGSVSGSGINIGVSNETLYALLSEPIATTMATPGFLAGISNDDAGSGGILTGTGLTSGTNFIDFVNDSDGFKYTGSRTSQTTFAGYLPLIMDVNNWQIEGADGTLILPISTTSFTTLSAGILSLGNATVSCTTIAGVGLNDDTYSVSIPFTIILNGKTFVLSTTGNVGTISGDSPSSSASGTIVISNIPEGTSFTFTADDTADGGPNTVTKAITSPVCFPLVINETLFDPPTDNVLGDANGDGTRSSSADEFIEFINTSNVNLDLSGYSISDASELRHVFPTGTIIPAGGTIVVFGGGTPTGIPGLVQIATNTGELNLNNGGDSIILKNQNDDVVINFNSGDTLLNFGSDQSGARNPDITGDFVLHNAIAGNPVAFSPGRLNADNVPIMKTWSGTTNNDWATATNWISDSTPSTSDNVVIPSGLTNYPTAAAAVTVNSATIASGASLIAQDNFTGNVIYKRNVTFVSGLLKGWYLMASPVSGQAYNDTYVSGNDIASNNTNRGLATYTTSADSWSYLQAAGSGTFTNGQGYSIKRGTTTGDVSFTGTLNTNNAGVDVALTTTGNRFNLLGNPYTAYLNSATFLNNEASISETKTLWVWNQTLSTNGAYEVKSVGDAMMIAPGQGFFVKANVAGGTFNFSEANQSHNADTFQKTAEKPEIKLWITDGEIKNYNRVKYLENATTGFDVGYEGEMFNTANTFAIYSQLVSNDQGNKYQLQSLPNSDYENMVVPIGMIANAGKEITISAEITNLPSGIKVFLENRANNTFTELNASSSFKTTLSENINGTGRFYLHTKASVLSVDDMSMDGISIYKTTNSNLRIAGLSQGKSTVKLFNMLGKQVLTNSFTSN